eukprot:364023-Chlamydomonas_euryale.AAC.2
MTRPKKQRHSSISRTRLAYIRDIRDVCGHYTGSASSALAQHYQHYVITNDVASSHNSRPLSQRPPRTRTAAPQACRRVMGRRLIRATRQRPPLRRCG